MKATTRSNKILRAQRALIVGYLVALTALAVAIALMPTKLLVFGGVYGHSILFWLGFIGAIVCYMRFKKLASLPKKAFTLCRSKASKCLLLATVAAFVLFVILQSTVGSSLGFILFAVCIFLLGLYLGANSYAYHIYRKHRKSHTAFHEK